MGRELEVPVLGLTFWGAGYLFCWSAGLTGWGGQRVGNRDVCRRAALVRPSQLPEALASGAEMLQACPALSLVNLCICMPVGYL